MEHTPDQKKAFASFGKWLDSYRQEFSLAGAAGTGKTTVLLDMLHQYGLTPIFGDSGARDRCGYLAGAVSNKAVRRMIESGITNAKTLFRIMYLPKPVSAETRLKINALEEKLFRLQGIDSDPEVLRQIATIEDEITSLIDYSKKFNPEALKRAAFILIDEASMVSREELDLIRSTNIRIIRVGDPFQLPPVEGTDDFHIGDADVLLQGNMRQVEGSPIADLVRDFRRGGGIIHGFERNAHGEWEARPVFDFRKCIDEVVNVVRRGGFVITDTHDRRKFVNQAVRKIVFEADEWHPREFEKLVMQASYRELQLCKGDVVMIEGLTFQADGCHVKKLTRDGKVVHGPFKISCRNMALTYGVKVSKEACTGLSVDFGYALTCHSAQGSERDEVVVYGTASFLKGDARHRWIYTAMTRARKRLLVFTHEIAGLERWRRLAS
jgi:exodeoxyribonuclease-5